MANTIRPHLRGENIVLDQKTVDALALPPGRSEVVIVAKRIDLNRARFVDKDVVIFADHVAGPLELTDTGITLTRSGPAPENTTGEDGCSLTIWTRTIAKAGGRSIGQTGGKGLPGRNAPDLVCVPPTPGDDPDDPKPGNDPDFEPEPGPEGGKGKDGAKGGRGGTITVNVVGRALDGSTPAPEPQDWLGQGGGGGAKGEGGKGGLGCPRAESTRGPQGEQGGSLGKGEDVPGVVRPATEQQLVDEFLLRVDHFWWAGVRMGTADKLARLGAPDEAELELKAVEQLGFTGSSITDDIRRRMRHRLTPFGVETDVNLRPAIDHHRAVWEDAVASYEKMVLTDGGHSVYQAFDRTTMLERHEQLKTDHTRLVTTELEQLRSERNTRIAELAEAAEDLGNLALDCRDRIDAIPVDKTIALPGGTLPAAELAARVVDVLGAFGNPGDVATRRLLAADPDLLAPAAENDRYPMPGSHPLGPTPAQQALTQLRAASVGLAGGIPATAVQPNPADWANPTVVVSLGRVRRELRAAGGDERLLLELTELVELAHRSRLVQLRQLQLDEGEIILDQLENDFASTQHILTLTPEDAFSLGLLAQRFLRAHRDAATVLAWRSHAAERSVSLYTVDSTHAGQLRPESAVPPTVAATGFLFDPDPEEMFEHDPTAAGPFLDFVLTQAGAEDANTRLAEYKGRGTFVEGPGDSAVDSLTFDSDQRAAVLARLKLNLNAWFDADIDELSPARFEHKVVGVGFTFQGLATPQPPGGAPPAREVSLTVEHSGLARQRRMDGAIIPQFLLPGSVDVTVKQLQDPITGEFGDVWSGFMRYDDVVPPDDPQDPGQTVSDAFTFPLWGRGAAGGWRFRFNDIVELESLSRFVFEVEYDGFAAPGQQPSLLRIEQPLDALVAGRVVKARAVLTGPAPAGGMKIKLASDTPASLSMPGFVVVPEGADRVDIPVTVKGSGGPSAPVRLTATTPDGFSRRTLAVVSAAPPQQVVTSLDLRRPGEDNGTLGGLAFAGDRLVVAYGPTKLHPDGTLVATGPGGMVEVDTAGGTLGPPQRFEVVQRPRAISVAGGKAYLISADPSKFSLSIVDLATHTATAETHVGFSPTQVAVDEAADLAYVGVFGSRTVEVLHGSTGAKLETVAGIRGPQGLTVDAARRRVYVAATFRSNGPDDEENGLAIIDRAPDGHHVLTRIVPIEAFQPMDVAYDAVRDLVHVVNLGGGGRTPGLTTLRGGDLAVLGFTPVPGPVLCLDVHQGSGTVFCAGPAQSVHVVDGVTRRHVASHQVTQNVQSIVVHQPTGAVFTGDRVSGRIARLAPLDVTSTTWR